MTEAKKRKSVHLSAVLRIFFRVFLKCNIYTCHLFLVNNGTELSNFASIACILVPAAIVWIMVK